MDSWGDVNRFWLVTMLRRCALCGGGSGDRASESPRDFALRQNSCSSTLIQGGERLERGNPGFGAVPIAPAGWRICRPGKDRQRRMCIHDNALSVYRTDEPIWRLMMSRALSIRRPFQ